MLRKKQEKCVPWLQDVKLVFLFQLRPDILSVKWRKWSSRQYFYFAETSEKPSSGFPLISSPKAFGYLILNKGLFFSLSLLTRSRPFQLKVLWWPLCPSELFLPHPDIILAAISSANVSECMVEKKHNSMISFLIMDNRSSINDHDLEVYHDWLYFTLQGTENLTFLSEKNLVGLGLATA